MRLQKRMAAHHEFRETRLCVWVGALAHIGYLSNQP
jgi:hypothetical protein